MYLQPTIGSFPQSILSQETVCLGVPILCLIPHFFSLVTNIFIPPSSFWPSSLPSSTQNWLPEVTFHSCYYLSSFLFLCPLPNPPFSPFSVSLAFAACSYTTSLGLSFSLPWYDLLICLNNSGCSITLLFIVALNHTSLAILRNIIVLNLDPFFNNLTPYFFNSNLNTLGNSLSKSTSTFTIAQLGLVWFLMAMSTCGGLPTMVAYKKTNSFSNKFGGREGNKIHAIAVDVSSSGLNIGSYFRVRMGNVQFFWKI